MTDIYVRRGEEPARRRRWPILILLILIIILGLAIYHFGFRSSSPKNPIEAVLPGPDEAPEAPSEPATQPSAGTAEPGAGRPARADNGLSWLADAREAAAGDDYREARRLAFRVLDQSRQPRAIRGARELLSTIHIEMVFSPREMEEKVDYTIQPGDTLGALARRFGTTVDLIRRSNNLSGSIIRVGDRLRILKGDFSMRISKDENILDLYLNDRFFKRYEVGTGKYARTPEGDFRITDRIAKPTWWRPDGKAVPYGSTNNVLGTHWLSLDVRGYGIHGTWEPESIGEQSSQGCVRLLNEEIEELYTLVPVGTPVHIED